MQNSSEYKTKNIFNAPYKYGFKTIINNYCFPCGLNEKIIREISNEKQENNFLLNFRLKSYKKWIKMKNPNWSTLNINEINYNNIVYFSKPILNQKENILDKNILKTFNKLGVDILEKKNTKTNIATEIVFDSVSVATTYKKKLAKFGIIFCSISDSTKYYTNLIEKYLGYVVSPGDNYFSALNSCVFSDGSFCYIPQNTICPLSLSTYFRINNENAGQFERTLIVAEKNSEINYIEGCTASKYDKNQLHAAVVELIAFDNANIKYSTVQNWYGGNELGKGGIYNFVTKRGLCIGFNSKILWTQVETGSSITWKYPSCILLGNNSIGEFYSVALTNRYQQADTGTKMVHLGKNTKSKITSKGISCKFSKNVYRGLVRIAKHAKNSKNFSQCDSFIIGKNSKTAAYPYIEIYNNSSNLEHEAKISKIAEDQLFYLLQRGITTEKSIGLMISGFCKDVFIKLPLEYLDEANKLLSLKLEKVI